MVHTGVKDTCPEADEPPVPPPDATAPVTSGTTDVSRRAWYVSALRLTAVVAVLCVELGFLTWVFHLDDPIEEQRVAVARVQTAVAAAMAAGEADPLAVTLDAAVGELLASGAPGGGAVSATLASGDVADPALLERLDTEVQQSATQVSQAGVARDRLVVELLLAMFVLVCSGWFSWFARLARRHRAAERSLTAREVGEVGRRRLEAMVHHGEDLVAVLDADSTATYVSPAAARMLGRPEGALLGERFVEQVEPDDQPLLAQLLGRVEGGLEPLTLGLRHHDGRVLSLEGTLNDLRADVAVGGWVLTLRDVTERRRLEHDLAHQSFHDSLTGLANRQLFRDRLEQARVRGADLATPIIVMFVDLDDFKVVNDSLGHQVGDELLVAVSERLVSVLRPRDTAARLGGDEFAVLLEDTDLETGELIASRVLATLQEPVVAGGRLHDVHASVGLAGLRNAAGVADGDQDLMRQADAAMYHAKECGKGGLAVYDPAMHQRVLEQLQLRAELAEAIAGDQLVLQYQPTIELDTQRITGFEALVRWEHPVHGRLPPLDFIPLAERCGLIVALGRWVLGAACDAGARMQGPHGGPSMAVNVAAQQLTTPGFHRSVVEALDASGLPAHRLVLEVTETALFDNIEVGAEVLAGLRELGVRVAIDDFGTGYNSLSTLDALPIDILKVDKSFVDRLAGGSDEEGDASLVEAVLAISAALGLCTVAEGVEQVEQARWLQEHHASSGQGYLWSKPVDLHLALELLSAGVQAVPPRPVGLPSLLTRPAISA